MIPFALTYAITQPYLNLHFFNLHFFFDRYEVIIMPAFSLLVGLGVQSLPMRSLQAAVVVALLEIAAVSAPYYYSHAVIQDFRTPIAWMQTQYQPGDGLICYPAMRSLRQAPLSSWAISVSPSQSSKRAGAQPRTCVSSR